MRKTISMELSGKATSTDDVILKSEYIKNTKLLCIQRMSATNEITSSKNVTFGAKVGKAEVWFETVALTTATYFYALKDLIFLQGDIQILMKFESPTANDVLRGFIFGYYETE